MYLQILQHLWYFDFTKDRLLFSFLSNSDQHMAMYNDEWESQNYEIVSGRPIMWVDNRWHYKTWNVHYKELSKLTLSILGLHCCTVIFTWCVIVRDTVCVWRHLVTSRWSNPDKDRHIIIKSQVCRF